MKLANLVEHMLNITCRICIFLALYAIFWIPRSTASTYSVMQWFYSVHGCGISRRWSDKISSTLTLLILGDNKRPCQNVKFVKAIVPQMSQVMQECAGCRACPPEQSLHSWMSTKGRLRVRTCLGRFGLMCPRPSSGARQCASAPCGPQRRMK